MASQMLLLVVVSCLPSLGQIGAMPWLLPCLHLGTSLLIRDFFPPASPSTPILQIRATQVLFTDPTLLSLTFLGGRIIFWALLKDAVGVQLIGFLSRPVGIMLTVSSTDADRKKKIPTPGPEMQDYITQSKSRNQSVRRILLVSLSPSPTEDAMGPDPCFRGIGFVLQLKGPGFFEQEASIAESNSCMVVWSGLWSL